MKKIFTVLLIMILSFSLVGCKDNNADEYEGEFEHNVPSEVPVNLQDLAYIDYLSLRNPVVTITVENIGDIVIQLFPNVAPNSVNNFIQYIEANSYDGNEFHRIVENFVIQAGDIQVSECNIAGEMEGNGFTNDLNHNRGVLSMARISGDYDSQSSQFFIMTTDNFSLDGEYAGFGGVVAGFNVIDYISSLKDSVYDFAVVPVVITTISIELNGYVPTDRVCAE